MDSFLPQVRMQEIVPLLAVRDVVVFPNIVVPLFVGRPKSLKALEVAMLGNRLIVIAAQKDPKVEDPKPSDLYSIGTLCHIHQMVKLPDNTVKVLVEGKERVRIDDFLKTDEFFEVRVTPISLEVPYSPHVEALLRNVISEFEKYVKLHPKVPPEIMITIMSLSDASRIADIIAANMHIKLQEKQQILEAILPEERLKKLLSFLVREVEVLELEKKIHEEVRKQMEQTQKEYYLREQLKAIQKELGRTDELAEEIEEYARKIKEAKMPPQVEEKAMHELKRLEKMPPMTAEATVVRTYLDWLVSLPWSKRTKDKLDISRAARILDEDHYGLEKVKERILEYLAVRKLSKKMRGQILCFVGPPGVGKTSLARSIARALNRKFVRISLGGVRDEAEIRGHRRTYVGALPGRIIQKIRQAGTKNPVFLLDEVDKIGIDFRGDPAAALLEVLDPEQNHSFSDHFLEVPFDLSEVMFITTANVTYTIPRPLLDRMEIIHIPGYTEEEKIMIALKHLIPKQLERHGLNENMVKITEQALRKIIREYTREAGVRNLEREIASICRKVARKIVESGEKAEKEYKITAQNLHIYLGPPKFRYGIAEEKDEIGIATGLAWTEVGGEILLIEAVTMRGKGKLTLTGNLGDVMQESAQAAVSYIRSHAKELGVKEDFYKNLDIHIHVPEGAIPKDGPSAGVAMLTALVSVLTGCPVRRDVAMTGEITLRGKVLPVGGIKEKVLAAHRAGITTVILPKDNEKDLLEIPPEVRKKINFKFVERMNEVLEIALAKDERREEALSKCVSA
ncbi:MAG: endopeptidase La [Synergistetes bacterium]|nr:endopeptidase La [Synergistota bacterium]MDK2871432.1 ATP-dependent Lon protease [bacterium]